MGVPAPAHSCCEASNQAKERRGGAGQDELWGKWLPHNPKSREDQITGIIGDTRPDLFPTESDGGNPHDLYAIEYLVRKIISSPLVGSLGCDDRDTMSPPHQKGGEIVEVPAGWRMIRWVELVQENDVHEWVRKEFSGVEGSEYTTEGDRISGSTGLVPGSQAHGSGEVVGE